MWLRAVTKRIGVCCQALTLLYGMSVGAETTDEEASLAPVKALEPIALLITFSDSPRAGTGKSFGSRAPRLPALSVMNGETVSFSRQQEPDQSVDTWFARVVDHADHEAMTVTPVVTDERLVLKVSFDRREAGERTRVNSVLAGRPGDWLTVMGGYEDGYRSFSSHTGAHRLAVKVERLTYGDLPER